MAATLSLVAFAAGLVVVAASFALVVLGRASDRGLLFSTTLLGVAALAAAGALAIVLPACGADDEVDKALDDAEKQLDTAQKDIEKERKKLEKEGQTVPEELEKGLDTVEKELEKEREKRR